MVGIDRIWKRCFDLRHISGEWKMNLWYWLSFDWFRGDDLDTTSVCEDLNGNGIPDCHENVSGMECYDFNGNGICDFWENDQNDCWSYDNDWTTSSWDD